MPNINFDLTTNNENEVLSKRCPKSAVMQMQMELPGGNVLANGTHTIGFIEGNVTISKVSLIIKKAFDGAGPIVSVTEEQGGTTESWITDDPLGVEAVLESHLTVPTVAGKQAPYYRSTKGEWKATIDVGGSIEGEFALLIDYVQMDAEPGKHS